MHTVYDRIFGDLPVKNNVCTPYIYIYINMANPTHDHHQKWIRSKKVNDNS
jgi:hypothetical protein